MQAMEILRRCRKAEEEIERMETRIQQRRAAADGMGSAMGETATGGTPGDRVGRIAAELADLESQKAERERERDAEITSACALVDFLPDKESKIVYHYWVDGMSTGNIADKLHYTQAYVRRIKRNGESLLGMLSEGKVLGTLPEWYIQRMKEKKR